MDTGKTNKLALLVSFLLVVSCCYQVQGACKKLKTPDDLKKCMNEKEEYEEVGMTKSYGCISKYLWESAIDYYKPNIDNKTSEYITYLFDKYASDIDDDDDADDDDEGRRKRQAFPNPPPGRLGRNCRRREIRQLNNNQYNALMTCYRSLKTDNSLSPNVFEAIANIHNGVAAVPAHGAQAFLSWHTIYMLVMEWALRECNPTLCLHYWDPRPDERLPNPSQSNFFPLLGGTQGSLDPPLSPWRGVTRAVGGTNILFSYDDWNRIMRLASSTSAISRGSSTGGGVIEFPHNRIHGYLRGTASLLTRAAHDPIFFCLHSFIEYAFDTALSRMPRRERKRYPRGPYNRRGHAPNDDMINLEHLRHGRRVIQNRDGYKNRWRRYFSYANSPTCQNGCQPSEYFYCCDGECVAYRQGTRQRTCNSRKKRSTNENYEMETDGIEENVIQNDYAINGVCDTSLWAYVGVNVLHYRSQNDHYDAYPIYDDAYDKKGDIYDPFIYPTLNSSIPHSNVKTYKHCKPSKSGKGYVYVTSYGANYDGKYDEYVITDYRQAVYGATAYMGIKKPTDNCSDVIFSASDECGRLCKPYCPVMGSNPTRYEPCDGIVRIDNAGPRIYGNTLGEAVDMYWESDNYVPHQTNVPYALQFVCDGQPYVSQ